MTTAQTASTLRPEPQVCMGGIIKPDAWNIVDGAGNWYGYVFYAAPGPFGDGRYWVEAPGMKRRGYATRDRAVAAVARNRAA